MIECIFEVGNLLNVTVFEHDNDVKTILIFQAVQIQVSISCFYQLTDLALVHELLWISKSTAVPCLDLDHNDLPLFTPGNDIDLRPIVSKIPLQNLISDTFKVGNRKCLSLFTQLVVIGYA